MKILITGSNGLLGQKIVKQCLKKGVEFLATSNGLNRNSHCPSGQYKPMDITDSVAVSIVFNLFKPTHIIHTAAMTNVDECEIKPTQCHEINVNGTQILFTEAQKHKAHFQLLSTDFVFDGVKGNYTEQDTVNPLSEYAKSKVNAENLLVLSNYKSWSIARTIIVYGIAENLSRTNIILWAREALKKDAPLHIVDDQFRMPTWADDLAWGCLAILYKNENGIFHLCGPEKFSIIDLIKAMAKFYKVGIDNIIAVSSTTLNQAAARPPNTGFDLSKSSAQLGYKPTSLEKALAKLEKELTKH